MSCMLYYNNRSKKQVTQDQLRELSKKFPHGSYHTLCLKLHNVEYNEAEGILTKHFKDYQKALMEVLMAWKTATGGYEDELKRALRVSDAGGLCSNTHIFPA